MRAKVGNVINNKSGLYIITAVIDGNIAATEKLEDYICRNSLIEDNGELKTIESVIQERCRLYLEEVNAN